MPYLTETAVFPMKGWLNMTVEKTCKECGNTHPRTREFFYCRQKNGITEYSARCIACQRNYNARMKRNQRSRDAVIAAKVKAKYG